jgi:Tfp pilus assembly protein PilF
MSGGDETIRVLPEALRASPDNVSLHLHLADTFLNYGRPEEAEQEYREYGSRSSKSTNPDWFG